MKGDQKRALAAESIIAPGVLYSQAKVHFTLDTVPGFLGTPG